VHVGDVVGHSMDEPFVHRGIIVEYAVDVVGYYLNVVDVLVNVVITSYGVSWTTWNILCTL